MQLLLSAMALASSILAIAGVAYAFGRFRGDTQRRVTHLEEVQEKDRADVKELFSHTMKRIDDHMVSEERENGTFRKEMREQMGDLTKQVAVLTDRQARTD